LILKTSNPDNYQDVLDVFLESIFKYLVFSKVN